MEVVREVREVVGCLPSQPTQREIPSHAKGQPRPRTAKSISDSSWPSPWPAPSLPVRANDQWSRPKQPHLLGPPPPPPAVIGSPRPVRLLLPLPTESAILVLNLVLGHFRSRPWPWQSPPAPPSRLSPPTIVLACSRTRPRRLLASAPARGRLFPQPPDVWQSFKDMKRQRQIHSERQGRVLKKNNRQTNHLPSTPHELKIGGGHGHGHVRRSPACRNQGQEGNLC